MLQYVMAEKGGGSLNGGPRQQKKQRGRTHNSEEEDKPEIGVSNAKVRHTISGGIIVEIPGQGNAAKADDLAARLREIFSADGES